jgi:hypothetical protein
MRNIYQLLFVLCFGFSGNAQIINIPNGYFKMILTVQSTVYGYAKDVNGQSMIVDANNDGEIEVSEAEAVYSLYVGTSVDDLTGIEYFINLRRLRCDSGFLSTLNVTTLTHLQILECQNNYLTSLNITGLSELTTLYAYANDLTSLDVTGCTSLSLLWLFDNELQTINVSGLVNIHDFRCNQNNLTSLDVSNLTMLSHFECYNNQLISLNVAGCTHMDWLRCSHNSLSNLNVSDLHNLTDLSIGVNPIANIDLTSQTQLRQIEMGGTNITTMDFSQFPLLNYVICNNCSLMTIDTSDNPDIYEIDCPNSLVLESIFMKNGRNNGLYATDCPLLRYICADEEEVEQLHSFPSYFDSININSYCSFSPGGVFYTIQGNEKYDSDNDGCDADDLAFPNLRYNITDGTIEGAIIFDGTGSYSIPVQEGTHTITPILENPDYFTVSPSNAAVTFPAEASPAIRDFCVIANGIHNDLEIAIIPLTTARAGFDANYKLVFKNKGTNVQTGTVNFAFDDAVLDFVSSDSTTISQTIGNLSWSFVNLQPFETREISLVLNLNSPTESPSLNSGDVLGLIALINGLIDETPEDNTALLSQVVTNSFDPNKKICLEGNSIGPEKVGDFVHYVIYFENNGTANAQNIVVKDILDSSKFDITSLIPVDGSDSFTTRISESNKIEFIFENINLPFDDAYNDGYVAFKIKTLPGLTLNSTFSNTASIYFDYNFPIVTNTANTIIQALSNQDFEFSGSISLFPNPARDILNIQAKSDIWISSLTIYNSLGQLVLIIPNAIGVENINVSSLKTGSYFIIVNTDKGTSSAKFIKD